MWWLQHLRALAQHDAYGMLRKKEVFQHDFVVWRRAATIDVLNLFVWFQFVFELYLFLLHVPEQFEQGGLFRVVCAYPEECKDIQPRHLCVLERHGRWPANSSAHPVAS